MDEKKALLGHIYHHLNEGVYFLDIDLLLAPTEALEQWYPSSWKERKIERQTDLKKEETYEDVIRRYKDKRDECAKT